MNTGGGFIDMRSWAEKHAPIECLRLFRLSTQEPSCQKVVYNLLEKGCPRMHATEIEAVSRAVESDAYSLIRLIVPVLKEKHAAEGIQLLSSRSGRLSPRRLGSPKNSNVMNSARSSEFSFPL